MSEKETEQKNLRKVETLTPAIFEVKKIAKLVEDISREVLSIVPNADTEKGRKEVRSLAYKVSRSKTTLDNMGKEHVAKIKSKAKVIDECRKTWRDSMDSLRDTVLKPVTEYEEREANRVREIEECLEHIRSFARADDGEGHFYTSSELNERRDQLVDMEINEDIFNELTEKAQAQWGYSLKSIATLIAGAEAEEAKAEEGRRLAEEQQKQEREAEEKRIREEAATQERMRIERELEEKRKEEERAAQEKARQEAKEKAEEEWRAQNKHHRAKVNREAMVAVQKQAGITEDQAKAVVKAIAKGQVPRVSINY